MRRTTQKEWAEQLRAGALEVAEKADQIVGDLTGNIEICVGIHLQTNTELITFPEITIERRLISTEARKVKIDQYTKRTEIPKEDKNEAD